MELSVNRHWLQFLQILHSTPRSLVEFVVVATGFCTADPTWASWVIGLGVTAVGVFSRVAASAYPKPGDKQELIVHGPYRLLRYPHLLGSWFVLLGFVLSCRSLPALLVLVGGGAAVYFDEIRSSDLRLRHTFGEAFRRFQASVSALVPQVIPGPPVGPAVRLSWRRTFFRQGKREIDSILAILAGYGLLYGCMQIPQRQYFHMVMLLIFLLFVCLRILYYRRSTTS